MNIGYAGVGPLLAAFAGGLLSFFSPCVAPLVPAYIGYLSGGELAASATGTTNAALVVQPARRSTILTSMVFVSGFSAAFVGLGLLAASFGRIFSAYQPVMQTIVGIVMLAMGAFLLGWLPRSWMQVLMREGRMNIRLGALSRLGYAGPFLLGIVFAAGWTPCIGPVLAALLTYVGATADVGRGALLLAIYSLGFALPFLALGLGWSVGMRSLGLVRKYGHVMSLITGVALILVSLLYLSGQVSAFAIWAQRFTPHF